MVNYYDSVFHISKDQISYEQIKRDLRVTSNRGYQGSMLVADCWTDDGDTYGIPIPYADSLGLLADAEDRMPNLSHKWPKAKFSPRHDQDRVIQETLDYLGKHLSGRISCPTSYGKTLCALEIAKRLNINLLFLVHKQDVLKQVEKTAKKFFNINKCGWIKGTKLELGHLITLSTMQTFCKRAEDMPEIMSNWGMACFDESHRASCKSYTTILQNLNVRYRLGVSATHRRSDGLEGVWDNYLGKLITKGVMPDKRIPVLECPIIGNTGLTMGSFCDYSGEVQNAKAQTKIATNVYFNNWIVDRILELLEEGRRPLITTDRKEQLEILEEMLHSKGITSVGIYAGGNHRKHRNLVDLDEIKSKYIKWHRREAVKKYKKTLKKTEKYSKKQFDAQYEIPVPSNSKLEAFYSDYVGDTIKEPDLVEAMKKDVVLATSKKVGEGFDESAFLGDKVLKSLTPMDTIIIAQLTKDSEQIIGRIAREDRSNHPLIIHPVLNIGYCQGMFTACWNKVYRPLGIKEKAR